ncbi:MAG: hypothetical protein KF732_10425 [Flavobacteriales bacterium]|nr:hypothetical protein [Flavobacteriales bacterium]
MLKSVKYGFIYVAMLLVLSHNLIPHQHKSQITVEQDAALHQSEDFSIVDVLALLFHEFTEEGEMENFVVRNNHDVVLDATSFVFVFLFSSLNPYVFEVIQPESTVLLQDIDSDNLTEGFLSAWSVRPPPFA